MIFLDPSAAFMLSQYDGTFACDWVYVCVNVYVYVRVYMYVYVCVRVHVPLHVRVHPCTVFSLSAHYNSLVQMLC